MKQTLLPILVALSGALIFSASVAAEPNYKIVDTVKIGGDAKWDYLYVDSAAHRLYVTHGTQTEVIDTQTDKVVGTIADTQGVHGVAIASDLGVGFTSNGTTNTLSVFDLATLKTTATIAVGSKPDAIVYAPASQKVVVFNGKSNDVSIIDAKTSKVIQTIKVAGKPEFAAVAKNGNVYFNIEDISEIAIIDLTANKLLRSRSLKPCEEPTGLAIDPNQNLYSVCGNNLMVITDGNGKVVGNAKIGGGVDGVAFLDGYAFSANGADGSLTAVESVKGKFQAVATIPTQVGARTIAADPATHRLYLPTADFQQDSGDGKRHGVPDSFRVLVLEKQ